MIEKKSPRLAKKPDKKSQIKNRLAAAARIELA